MPDRHEKDNYNQIEQISGKVPDGVEEVADDLEVPDGVEGYVEKIEKAGEVGVVSVSDDGSQTGSQQAKQNDFQLPDDAVVLPMTQDEFEEGIHEPLIRGVRWLAEWCAYMIKKFGEKVFFKG